jgi:hypothetical protein
VPQTRYQNRFAQGSRHADVTTACWWNAGSIEGENNNPSDGDAGRVDAARIGPGCMLQAAELMVMKTKIPTQVPMMLSANLAQNRASSHVSPEGRGNIADYLKQGGQTAGHREFGGC